MKTIKDLTEEQFIELVYLAFPFTDDFMESIKKSIRVKYQPYDWTHYEDAAEYWYATFEIPYLEKLRQYQTRLYSDLNIYSDTRAMREDTKTLKEYVDSIHSIGVAKQHQIHKKLIEWGIEPNSREK